MPRSTAASYYPLSLSHPTSRVLSSPAPAPATPHLGAALSLLPPQMDLCEPLKCPVHQSQDHRAELRQRRHFLETGGSLGLSGHQSPCPQKSLRVTGGCGLGSWTHRAGGGQRGRAAQRGLSCSPTPKPQEMPRRSRGRYSGGESWAWLATPSASASKSGLSVRAGSSSSACASSSSADSPSSGEAVEVRLSGRVS